MAHIILPIGYVALCVWMFRRRVWWFTYLAYFFVFGASGGWFLMLEVASLGAVPITAIPALGMELFLLTAAVFACLASSLVLQFRENKDRFERGAMFGGYSYLALHPAFIMIVIAGHR
ncbi:MAG: hypothetical protein ABI222_11620 [Opitutaceae bacterium]